MKKILLTLCFIVTAHTALPYTYSFYNATSEPVWIDPHFSRLSLGEEQMFAGNAPRVEFNPTILEWSKETNRNPERIKGPIQLLPNKRYVFKFADHWSTGLCIDRIFVGWTEGGTRKADIKIAESSQSEQIKNAALSFTQQVSGAAQSVGEAAGEFTPKGKAAQGAARSSGQAAESLVSGLLSLLTISRCGGLDFVIATDQDKNLSAIIEK